MFFAVHLPVGSLPETWCVVGYIVAIALAVIACLRLHERDIPRIALTTAAYFVASSISISVPGGSVHLVLNGFVGVLLGFRAGIALLVGLFLQAVLVNHGGIDVLGVNDVLQAIPALAIAAAFHGVARNVRSIKTLAIWGGVLGSLGVVGAVLLQSAVLWLAHENANVASLLWLGLHVPVALIEGIVVGFMVHYLARVKPELLGLERLTLRDEPASIENSVMAGDDIS